MKVATIVGARPQFVKSAVVSRALSQRGIEELLIHTGQHYDLRLSDVFFRELEMAEPYYNLSIGSGSHGRQTGQMLTAIEDVLRRHKPEMVLIYGDTNSTLAGALAASKLRIPLAHIEAGMRSGDRAMPEEINRIVADHVSDLLLCATKTAVANLTKEGLNEGVHLTGDVMYDLLRWAMPTIEAQAEETLMEHQVTDNGYLLATVHRPRNADDPTRLLPILDTLLDHSEPVLLPLHPRTRAVLEGLSLLERYQKILIPPLGYLEMQALLRHARILVTDSGGLQKESYLHGTPCLTLMPQSEWVETVTSGWNRLTEPAELSELLGSFKPTADRPDHFGNGKAGEQVAELVESYRI